MNGQAIHALIVEDSITQAAQLKYILEKHGITSTTAKNGREAMTLLEQFQPTIILSDVVMPEMDGYEFCTMLKQSTLWHDIPLILLTSLYDEKSVVKGLMCGADNYLSKPYKEERIVARIKQVLGNLQSRTDHLQNASELYLNDERMLCRSGKQQILDFLLSTYEDSLAKHRELDESYQKLATAMSTIKVLESKYRNQAIRDELTGLFNRRGFFNVLSETIEEVRASGQYLYLFYFDLDHFKQINDTYGHDTGDQALRDTSTVLKSAFREADIIGRLGGDEFAVAAISDYESLKEKSCMRIQESLAAFNARMTRRYQLNFSFGVAVSSSENQYIIEDLVKEADQIMYANKLAKKSAMSA